MAKIAILSFYSQIVERGVETFAYEISRRLIRKHQITIFHAGQKDSQKISNKNQPPSKVKVQIINTSIAPPKSANGIFSKFYLDKQSARILIFTLKLLPSIFKEKFDIIIPLNGVWQTLICRIITQLTGARMIISGHAGIGRDDAANLFFRPDVFVALTCVQKKWAKRLAPEVKIVLIPNGVDLSRFHPKVSPKNIPLEKPVVVCSSALDAYKRIDLTIKAVAKTRKLSLLVLGDGELRGLIDGLGKRSLGKRYLRMVVPYQEIPSYYRVGKVFTLASKTEAFGISYIEAMACNLPVVATSDESRAEIIGNAGILTNPEDIDQYAKDLTIAAKTNYRNIPYTQALNFSWNRIAKKYSSLMNEIIKP